MLPEYKDDADGQFLFIYPATFDIEYYVGAEQNKHIHKHTSCVLTNVAVDYTPNGSYAYFNKNGAPIQINVRMDFRELEIITRKDTNELL
jgi:trimethylamine:corrinoid methyltransferase-like protein